MNNSKTIKQTSAPNHPIHMGQGIQHLREQNRLTPEELAGMMEGPWDQKKVCNLEKMQTAAESTLRNIAQALDIDPAALRNYSPNGSFKMPLPGRGQTSLDTPRFPQPFVNVKEKFGASQNPAVPGIKQRNNSVNHPKRHRIMDLKKGDPTIKNVRLHVPIDIYMRIKKVQAQRIIEDYPEESLATICVMLIEKGLDVEKIGNRKNTSTNE